MQKKKSTMEQPSRPFALNMRDVFNQAVKELAIPAPAVKLNEWTNWNAMTGGFRPREFTILCGSTGSGKTTLLANLSAQLLRQRVKHFVMSVETGHTDFMKRVMSVIAGEDLNTGDPIPLSKIETLTARHMDDFFSDTIEFSLYDNRVAVEVLMGDLEYMAGIGCKIAFIDNLNFFLEVKKATDQIIEVDRVIHELIIFCKRIDIHLVMVMHPRKSDGQSTRVNSEYEVKGSATAVQEAHNVFLFNRPAPEDVRAGIRSESDREIKIAKMRRRGKFVGKTLLLKSVAGVAYRESGIV